MDMIDRVVHYSRNRNPWYGIGILLPVYGTIGSPLKLMIERGDGRMYYGLVVPVENPEVKRRAYDQVKQAVAHLHHGSCSGWPVVVSTRRNLDFEGFNHPDTLLLANPLVREEAVRELWQDIRAFMQQMAEVLSTTAEPGAELSPV